MGELNIVEQPNIGGDSGEELQKECVFSRISRAMDAINPYAMLGAMGIGTFSYFVWRGVIQDFLNKNLTLNTAGCALTASLATVMTLILSCITFANVPEAFRNPDDTQVGESVGEGQGADSFDNFMARE